MTERHDDVELIETAARRFGVPTEVLSALLALEESFQNFTVFGTKAEFTRRVYTILDDASSASSASSKAEK
ncbi:hypothetical protein GJ697_09835 [Pseudoduganella sp. FT25W]|uniref:Uncharacterized protein n=1 Tax=Duganella alba TaxID=2666081 RepID=A0A6L5QFU3_9BURK|nr:hypothetical protein [Duganella alba]MRX08132.1 hypothetical protein [Duganella alba]MRX16331.1 hypothetical protein [Duganella alba]